ncbi:pyrophosphate--fructose-6-phosphate 1-phosphotransferase [Candidatus Neomarinimicrobiota bacterium]
MNEDKKVAFLTAGGIAPCLSASIGALIFAYTNINPETKFLGYLNGYRGLLLGNKIKIPSLNKHQTEILLSYGGSPLGNSRVKLTNVANCLKHGYIKNSEDPIAVAAKQLIKDGISILHTIGGDDTNTMAGELEKYIKQAGHDLVVVGLPKTVDNDVYPIAQSLGAWTAAEQGALFFENIANENTTSTRQLIVHEVMGRNCGWLTAATAAEYRNRLLKKEFLPELMIFREKWDIDAVYIPEMNFALSKEIKRLKNRMDQKDGVNIFLSEGAGIKEIVSEMEASREDIPRDAFGHIKLDLINPGQWFAKKLSKELEADKVLVQKSGYFARSAAPSKRDLDLIIKSAELAVQSGLDGKSGVVGLDDNNNEILSLIEFDRVKGGKPFNINQPWFVDLLREIGQ